MNFSLSTSAPKKVPAREYTVQDLLNIQDALHQSWMDLDASIKQIDEVKQIMSNINFSIEAVTKYGVDAVKILNVDGSLESLMSIEEKLITAEKAVESLYSQDMTVGEKLKIFIAEMWRKFATLCVEVVEFFKRLVTSCDTKISAIKSATHFNENKEVEITTPDYFNVVRTFRDEFMAKIPGVCNIAENMSGKMEEWYKDQQIRLLNEFITFAKKYENQKFLNVDQGNEKVHFIGLFEPSTTTMKACGWNKDKVVKLVDSYKQNFEQFNSWSQKMKLFALKMKEMKINSMNSSDRQYQSSIRASTGSRTFSISGYTDLGKTIVSILIAAEKMNMSVAKLFYRHVIAFYSCIDNNNPFS